MKKILFIRMLNKRIEVKLNGLRDVKKKKIYIYKDWANPESTGGLNPLPPPVRKGC